MTPARKLRLLLIRDICIVIIFAGFVVLPEPFGFVGLFAAFFPLKRFGGELLRTETRLGSTEKRVYFSTVLGWELAALALLTAWLTRHARPQPWALGTLGWAVALVLIYASYDRVYGHNANV